MSTRELTGEGKKDIRLYRSIIESRIKHIIQYNYKGICCVDDRISGQVPDVAQVHVVIGAGDLTQLAVVDALWRGVVVQTEGPAGVKLLKQISIGGDPLEILLGFWFVAAGVREKRERYHFLIVSA